VTGRRSGGVAAVTGNGDALEAVIRHATLIDDDYLAIEPTVEALAKSTDTSLVPRLEEALEQFLDHDNFYGRDLMALILAAIQGIAALPALLRAVARDLGDDQDSLPAEIDSLLMMNPSGARPMVVRSPPQPTRLTGGSGGRRSSS